MSVPSRCDGSVHGQGYLGQSSNELETMTALFLLFVCFVFSLRKDPDVSSSPDDFGGEAEGQREEMMDAMEMGPRASHIADNQLNICSRWGLRPPR